MKPIRKKRYARRLDNHRILKHGNGAVSSIATTNISLDEFEAIRLCDYENLSQIDAAKEMEVSRGTIQRLLENGRKKLVDGILNYKTIEVKNDIRNIKLKGENKLTVHLDETVKVAFPSSDKVTIDIHFGHAGEFAIYTVKNNEVLNVKYITPVVLRPGSYPESLKKEGVDLVIASKVGDRMINLFKTQGIEIILGAKGRIDVNLNEYLGGFLDENGVICVPKL
jgi:predicted DNA-binding protein (UPF0251 family)/predicted Fe-Mo cluster-binding NifX family protein